MMCCFSCEADDRLEVASGMGQDCSCCGCFGQNRKFQSYLQVRKQTKVYAGHSADPTLLSARSSLTVNVQNKIRNIAIVETISTKLILAHNCTRVS